MPTDLPEFLNSEAELNAFLDAFAEGTLPKEAFTHAAHVAMASCYCLRFDEAECLERVRRDIQSFNERVGGTNTDESGYHETLTRFWLDRVRYELRTLEAGLPRDEAVRRVVRALGRQRELFRSYYSFDVVQSKEARQRWMEPDLDPLV